MKILVCGSRDWSDRATIERALLALPAETIVVHGFCRGADLLAGSVARSLGMTVRFYPADWEKYGRSAGPRRNAEMLRAEHLPSEPIDLCLAFHDDIERSRGTLDMVTKARGAGIEVRVIRSSKR